MCFIFFVCLEVKMWENQMVLMIFAFMDKLLYENCTSLEDKLCNINCEYPMRRICFAESNSSSIMYL